MLFPPSEVIFSFFFEEDFDLNAPDIQPPEYVHTWIQDKIMESAEVRDARDGNLETEDVPQDAPPLDDNLPF